MSVNIYTASTGKLTPLAGIPRETLDSKADSSALYSTDNTETTLVAEKSHTSGDYFEVNGSFVKALDDISVGDTLEEGVNIETTNVGDELSSMKESFTDGCDTIVQAVTAMGQTPASNSPSDIATAIENIETGDETHGAITETMFDNMTDTQLLALSEGVNTFGTAIDIEETDSREVTDNGTKWRFTLTHNHLYNCSILKEDVTFDPSVLTKEEVTFDELLSVLREKNSSYRSQMVGKLVTGLTNSLYSGSYRIIGKDHDGSSNTFDLLTEDCVQRASNGFGSSNRHYDDSGCYARIFVEETFYNAFDSTIKEHIKPMDVNYRYSTSTTEGSTGTLRTLTNKYGKLLSYNEVGTIYSSPGNYYETCRYADAGSEGTVYEYFNLTGSALSNIRIKKFNGSLVSWWLRSRYTSQALGVSYIYTDGIACNIGYNAYNNTSCFLAPVLRIGLV